jgi:ComF family protein
LLQIIKHITDFIFPKISIVTGNRLNEDNSNDYVEDDVLDSLEKVTAEELDKLNIKVNSDYAFSLYDFDASSPIQQIIHHLKYRGMKRVGIFLGELIGKELEKDSHENLNEFDYIVPVPLYKTKLRERGYNQSDYLCKGLKNILKVEIINDLVNRTRHTKSQTKLTISERIENVKDAFEINKKYQGTLVDKKIILVDDVITTGSTLNEVIKVLREEKILKIFVITAAMAKK